MQRSRRPEASFAAAATAPNPGGSGGCVRKVAPTAAIAPRRPTPTAGPGFERRAILRALRFSLVAIGATALLSTSCRAATESRPAPDAEPRVLEGRVVGVTDGDTLTLLVDREPVRVRLAQIDAPESGQPYGRQAKAALSALAFAKRARVEVVDTDRYGRTVGEVFVDEVDLNREMVREGHAWAYTKYSHTTEIIALEDAARAAKKGLWALPESQREPPWLWRHPSRAPRTDPGPLACGERTHCGEMAHCEEARFYFEQCGVHSLDGDGDGVPCESLCEDPRPQPGGARDSRAAPPHDESARCDPRPRDPLDRTTQLRLRSHAFATLRAPITTGDSA